MCISDSCAGRPLKLFLVELALAWAGRKGGAALKSLLGGFPFGHVDSLGY